MVPEVDFWGFWGLVSIEKWSQNFDSGIQNAIFGTPKMGKTAILGVASLIINIAIFKSSLQKIKPQHATDIAVYDKKIIFFFKKM